MQKGDLEDGKFLKKEDSIQTWAFCIGWNASHVDVFSRGERWRVRNAYLTSFASTPRFFYTSCLSPITGKSFIESWRERAAVHQSRPLDWSSSAVGVVAGKIGNEDFYFYPLSLSLSLIIVLGTIKELRNGSTCTNDDGSYSFTRVTWHGSNIKDKLSEVWWRS